MCLLPIEWKAVQLCILCPLIDSTMQLFFFKYIKKFINYSRMLKEKEEYKKIKMENQYLIHNSLILIFFCFFLEKIAYK